ncbi:hypothetical protein [Pseudomonas sp.]|uniref:hypothetical protein n=1 Tax=Pseudomonas sp. TaxID=306 RepID=UPI00289D9596|nr:hypothetical protein [Pseudomonas sp.]
MKALVICLIAPLIILALGARLDTASISSILNLLVAIAGAIFTIMSIWVAFLYPNVLKTLKGENVVNIDFSSRGEDTTRLKEIISVIIQSATTMIMAVIFLIILSCSPSFKLDLQLWLNGIAQFGMLYFSGIQISALISTIKINVRFIDVLDKQRNKRARDWDT